LFIYKETERSGWRNSDQGGQGKNKQGKTERRGVKGAACT